MDLRCYIQIGHIICKIADIKTGVKQSIICLGRVKLRDKISNVKLVESYISSLRHMKNGLNRLGGRGHGLNIVH